MNSICFAFVRTYEDGFLLFLTSVFMPFGNRPKLARHMTRSLRLSNQLNIYWLLLLYSCMAAVIAASDHVFNCIFFLDACSCFLPLPACTCYFCNMYFCHEVRQLISNRHSLMYPRSNGGLLAFLCVCTTCPTIAEIGIPLYIILSGKVGQSVILLLSQQSYISNITTCAVS